MGNPGQSEVGRLRKRNSQNPKSGRWLFLGVITVICTVVLATRVVWCFMFLYSGGATNPYEEFRRDVSGQDTANWIRQNETTIFVVRSSRAMDARASEDEEEEPDEEEKSEKLTVPDAIAYLEQLKGNLTEEVVKDDDGPYHSKRIFLADYEEMKEKLRIFVYPHSSNDPFLKVFAVQTSSPTGNYASEAYFKQALMKSSFVTKHAAEANFFYLPLSITNARLDRRVWAKQTINGLQKFCEQYVTDVRAQWSYWNRSSGADHFYLSCHSVARNAMDRVPYVRQNAIQLVCPASYFLPGYVTHKDASVPQIWPRLGSTPKDAGTIKQRKRLAFFAGALNSEVRLKLAKVWGNDEQILVHRGKVPFPYSEGMLTSKFCLHAKGFEVNTARLGDAMFYGCVPVVIANHYDLPFQDVLDWTKFALVVSSLDIPLLKKALLEVTDEQYAELHKNVMQARPHFQWHTPPHDFDAFHMVMYELWARRHVVRHSLH